MSLNKKQARFTECLGELLTYATATGQYVILAEAYRTPEQAAIYAKQGKGIKNSVHTKKLAVDLFRYKDGSVTWDRDEYQKLGDYWKTLDPDARWGGDFRNRDAVHFSFTHNGVA
jgi:hypothetical protein